MKVLVYGAGVIGSYLAHVLCAAGQEVTLLARGRRKADLESKGLVLVHRLQRKRTVDHPRVVGSLDPSEPYDAVFAVLQYQQMRAIVDDLAAANAPLAVLVGNNLSAPELEEAVRARSATPKTVLFGFQGTAGRRENGEVVCFRMGAGRLNYGHAHSAPDGTARATLEALFRDTPYQLVAQPDMDAWYKCHLALILPIAYACYAVDCDLTRAPRALLRQALDAAREGYALLAAQGCPILPEGTEAFFRPGLKRAYLSALLWVMARTALGRLAASDHCRNAVAEMEALDRGFAALRARTRDFPMPNWDALRARMPDWEALHGRFDQARRRAEGGNS